MKTKGLLVAGVVFGVAVVGATGFWWMRNQRVVVEVPEETLTSFFENPQATVNTKAGWTLPWDSPDLKVEWIDPWSSVGNGDPTAALYGKPPSDILAYDPLGILALSTASVPEEWTKWETQLEAVKIGKVPLALSGRSDSELLTSLLWFLERTKGAQYLQDTFSEVSTNPSAGVDPSGFLRADHPWRSAVTEVRDWLKRGWISPQWLDYSEVDVMAAVAEGRAAFGLGWSSLQRLAHRDGVPTTNIAPLPVPADRSSSTTMGRWLALRPGKGWGSAEVIDQVKKDLLSSASPEQWLRDRGLVLASPDLPNVDQESRRLSIQLLRSGAMVITPWTGANLERWHDLLESIRLTLRS